jgi:two-component system KDP operon response regulator KdpE
MKILLVDDDEDLAYAMASTLRHEGHDVATAPSGGEALRLAQTTAPEAVLLDLQLPDANGFEIAHAMREGLIAQDVSIIVITGTKAPRLDDADEAGVDLLLSKPVESQHLSGLVEYITRRRHDVLRAAKALPPRCLQWPC